MQYATEDLSPVKKKITVTVPAEEVDAALAASIAMYRTNVKLDGFRKGKVPATIVEQRFRGQIYHEATTDLVNVHINDIMGEARFTPVSRIDFDGGELEKGKEFVYNISFEIMPAFELPAYEGLEVEQEEPEVDEKEVDAVLERIRSNMAEVLAVGDDRFPSDGDIAVIDFAAVDENGDPIAGIKADNFQLELGSGQTLGDFETLIKSMKAGEEKEGPVSFPQDFFNPEFAGRTVTMKAKLHAIKERKLPELDDDLAKKTGGFAGMEAMRESVRQSYLKSRTELNKSAAQKKLLDDLLKLVDFPVPDSLLQVHVSTLVNELRDRLARQGKDFASLGKTEEQIRTEVEPEALMRARSHIFLLSLAREKGFSVSEQEVDIQIRRLAMQSGQDYNAVKDHYTRNNLLFVLRDKLMTDKAMDEIYDKALVKKIPARQFAPSEGEAEASGPDASAASAAQSGTGSTDAGQDAPEANDETAGTI